MINQTLYIYNFNILYLIFDEIKIHLPFSVLVLEKENISNNKNLLKDNSLIISKSEIPNLNNVLIIDNFPVSLEKLLETISINFLKNRFSKNSNIKIGKYLINLNSRELIKENKKVDLTEKETQLIIYLKNSPKPVATNELQKNVWGHSLKLETHTVETHIYRLRKKIYSFFNDDKFILSSKLGYFIK
tara:strand:- start:122 stop:685 length:564 start_codon:yes stop_codon:yes gene_type:complete